MAARATCLILAVAVVVGSAGCATTRIVLQWSSPDYTAPAFTRIVVIGISRDPAIRRTFEDEFVTRLKATGTDAEPSYRYIPENGPVAEARLQEAVRAAHADASLVTRLVRVETRTYVSPGTYYPGPLLGLGFYRGYSAAWLGYYDPPRVYQYDVYISETSLYDTGKNELVWTGTVQTTAPRDVVDEIRRYVDVVVEALQTRRLLAAPAGQASPAGAYLWPSRSSQRR